jgi:uncharacterized protein
MKVLHWASFHGHVRVVRGLLEAGAEINARVLGHSSLMLASSKGHEDVVKCLLSHGADVDITAGRVTALTNAAFYNHPGILSILFDHGANFNLWHWWTVIHAASLGHLEVARLLLEHGADPNLPLGEGLYRYGRHTAVYQAVFYEHVDLVTLLMENGASAKPGLDCLVSSWPHLSASQERCLHELLRRSWLRKMRWKWHELSLSCGTRTVECLECCCMGLGCCCFISSSFCFVFSVLFAISSLLGVVIIGFYRLVGIVLLSVGIPGLFLSIYIYTCLQR